LNRFFLAEFSKAGKLAHKTTPPITRIFILSLYSGEPLRSKDQDYSVSRHDRGTLAPHSVGQYSFTVLSNFFSNSVKSQAKSHTRTTFLDLQQIISENKF